MAWSDAARAAAKEARQRKHLSSIAAAPTHFKFYHGGPSALKGTRLHGSGEQISIPRRAGVPRWVSNSSYSTTDLRRAMTYANTYGGRVYPLAPGKSYGVTAIIRSKLTGGATKITSGGGAVASRIPRFKRFK